MVYAGNGYLIVSFEKAEELEQFTKLHVSFSREKSTLARQYPQFAIVKSNPYTAIDPNGNQDDFWTNEVWRCA